MYFGDKFSTKSMVGTVVRNKIGVPAILAFYSFIENVSQKIFEAKIL
jgi:hypothetical protein